MNVEKQTIMGLHSIVEALKNPARQNKFLLATEKGLGEFKKNCNHSQLLSNTEIKLVSLERLQEDGQRLSDIQQRIPGQILLFTDALPVLNTKEFLKSVIGDPARPRIICLDQVTDVQNAAAIYRTAAFFGVKYIVLSQNKDIIFSPGFTRIASGGLEYIHTVRTTNLSRLLVEMKEQAGFSIIGFSEHSTASFFDVVSSPPEKYCLVLGAEDFGISHAVSRILDLTLSIPSTGSIKSLNVSVASGIVMSHFYR